MVSFKQKISSPRRAAPVRSTATLLAASAGAALLALTLLRATAAQAGEPAALGDGAPAVPVSYADLNLTREGDARILLRRIRLAAAAVCPAADNRDLRRLKMRNRCVQQAIARAVQQVDSPRLAAVYSARPSHG